MFTHFKNSRLSKGGKSSDHNYTLKTTITINSTSNYPATATATARFWSNTHRLRYLPNDLLLFGLVLLKGIAFLNIVSKCKTHCCHSSDKSFSTGTIGSIGDVMNITDSG